MSARVVLFVSLAITVLVLTWSVAITALQAQNGGGYLPREGLFGSSDFARWFDAITAVSVKASHSSIPAIALSTSTFVLRVVVFVFIAFSSERFRIRGGWVLILLCQLVSPGFGFGLFVAIVAARLAGPLPEPATVSPSEEEQVAWYNNTTFQYAMMSLLMWLSCGLTQSRKYFVVLAWLATTLTIVFAFLVRSRLSAAVKYSNQTQTKVYAMLAKISSVFLVVALVAVIVHVAIHNNDPFANPSGDTISTATDLAATSFIVAVYVLVDATRLHMPFVGLGYSTIILVAPAPSFALYLAYRMTSQQELLLLSGSLTSEFVDGSVVHGHGSLVTTESSTDVRNSWHGV